MAAIDPEGPRLTGRVALVTGASKGIGKATAKLLASRGAKVMATGRSESDLRELGLDYVIGDLSKPEDCRRIVEETRSRLGPIEILVNNAGLGSAAERVVWEQDPEVWHDTMRVNVDGPFYVCRAALPDMVERGFGRCVFVSSTAGVRADREMSAYCTSKSGLLGLMRALAQDAGPFGVTSNAVLPGWVRTEMAERSVGAEAAARGIDPEELWAEKATSYPAGRVVTMDEVAEAIAFLAGDGASGINGEEVTVALGSHW
jgi:NAD(P)-dependent dehydrogenase (short-subunit alcohol dehydrogenase family)